MVDTPVTVREYNEKKVRAMLCKIASTTDSIFKFPGFQPFQQPHDVVLDGSEKKHSW